MKWHSYGNTLSKYMRSTQQKRNGSAPMLHRSAQRSWTAATFPTVYSAVSRTLRTSARISAITLLLSRSHAEKRGVPLSAASIRLSSYSFFHVPLLALDGTARSLTSRRSALTASAYRSLQKVCAPWPDIAGLSVVTSEYKDGTRIMKFNPERKKMRREEILGRNDNGG